MRLTPLLAAALLAALPAERNAAQCGPVSQAVAAAYGSGCGPLPGPTALSIGYDLAPCPLVVKVETPPSILPVTLLSRLLVVGAQPISIPVLDPLFGCALLASPDALFANPAQDDDWAFALPPAALGNTAYLQGANLWVDTFAFELVPQASPGYKVDFL